MNDLPSFCKLDCLLLYYMSFAGSVTDCKQVISERIISPYSFLNAQGLKFFLNVPFLLTLRIENYL